MDNSCIFWAIKELVNSNITSMTTLNIAQMIESNGAVKREIESRNIHQLQEYVDDCFYSKRDTVEEYKMLVNRVVELAFKRDLYREFHSLQKLCFNEDIHLGEFSNLIYKKLNDINARYITDGEITPIGDKVDEIMDNIESKKQRGESYGFPSAFDTVDNYFRYEEGELVVISARMKKGKSIVAMMEGYHKAVNGVPTLIQDSEMSDELWMVRLVSYLTGIRVKRIKEEILTSEELSKIEKAKAHIKTLPLYHNYDPYMTKEKFYSICSQKIMEVGLKFVIWDYIKCDDKYVSTGERSAYLGGMTNWLKNVIAGDLDLAVLAFAQLNRSGDIADSDGIERYCSVSVFWDLKTDDEIAQDGQNCGTHKLKVKLNRLGEQHLGDREYIDMKFLNDGRLGVEEAEQHIAQEMPY